MNRPRLDFTPEPDFTSENRHWTECRFMTCSVLPVRLACNCRCPFCFSKSSISSLQMESSNWEQMPVESYYEYARSRGATRLVITGGGEPLLRPADCLNLVRRGKPFFDEIALFTNGTYLNRGLAESLRDTGLSYVCYSRHHFDDDLCRKLMGKTAPSLKEMIQNCTGLTIRATCVMVQGGIDSPAKVSQYIERLSDLGVQQFTFKHTYVAYEESLFKSSSANQWSSRHQVSNDPFVGQGEVIGELPWGPKIRRIEDKQVCYYYEPTPQWELENRLCRSTNLMSDGVVYASLEDQQSQLFQLKS